MKVQEGMMNKIVGNILLVCLMSSVQAVHSFTFRALDRAGKTLTSVPAGKPFVIEIALEDQEAQNHSIKGLDQFVIMGRQTSMHVMNGKRSMKYLYTVRHDKPGIYTVGPALVTLDGQQKQREPITITIDAPDKESQGASTLVHSDSPVFMRMTLDKQSVVVGEKIVCTLKIFCLDTVGIQDILQPQWGTLSVISQAKFEQTETKIKGVRYLCVTGQWELMATQAGKQEVAACGGDFKIPLDEPEHDVFSHMVCMMHGPRYSLKRVYSNSVPLRVDPLPPCDKKVQGIGEYTHFTAHIKSPRVKEGEGTILTLTVEGKGNESTLTTLPLEGLPESLKSYESKSYTQALANGTSKKSFEYIVQGAQEGTWHIPAQFFTYFNTASRKYVTLETVPLSLTITPSAAGSKIAVPPAKESGQEALSLSTTDGTHPQCSDDILPIITQGAWSRKDEYMLPWWFFGICLLAPVVMVVKRGTSTKRFLSKKHIFKRAYSALVVAQQQQQPAQLYSIFMHVLESRWGLMHSELTQEVIETTFKQKGFSAGQIDDWNNFFSRISEYAYGVDMPDASRGTALLTEARQWLVFLEEKL